MVDPARRRTALVTGASAGIGAEFARQLAGRGYDLILVARRVERLEQLAREIGRNHGSECEALVCDLSQPSAVDELCATLVRKRKSIDFLVNNAGYSIHEPFTGIDWPRHLEFLNVLLLSVVKLCHALLPAMAERGFGRVVNVASLAAFLPGAHMSSLYSPTKSFLVKMSQALASELRGTNVHVCALCPGFTYSEFHDVNGTRGAVSHLPRFMWMPAEPVVRAGLDAVERGRVVCVPGTVNQLLKVLMTFLPDALISGVWTDRIRRLTSRQSSR